MAKNVTKTSSGLPASVAEAMEEDAGRGVSTRQEDNLIPMMIILQAQSPQVIKRNPAYVEGAEAGSIFVRGLPEPLFGEEGVLFQPCHFTKKWVEWVPRSKGGGLVDRYDDRPEDAELRENEEGKKTWIRPNGNELVETRYHSGYIHLGDQRIPVVIPLSSTGHSFSKEWMLSMNMKRTPQNKTAPSWAYLYQLSTRVRSNAAGEWFAWGFKDAGAVSSIEDYQIGRTLNEAIEGGAKQFDESQEDAADVRDPDADVL